MEIQLHLYSRRPYANVALCCSYRMTNNTALQHEDFRGGLASHAEG